MNATLEELPDRHVWTFHDHRVTQLVVEPGAVRLVTWTLHASLDVRLGTPFTIRQADGIDRPADPDEPEQLAPLLTLVGRWVETLTATTSAELEIAFSDGTHLVARRDPRYEAWQVQGGGALEGIAYVARPTGGTPWQE
jgi:Family of unknown function (DUF6188)